MHSHPCFHGNQHRPFTLCLHSRKLDVLEQTAEQISSQSGVKVRPQEVLEVLDAPRP